MKVVMMAGTKVVMTALKTVDKLVSILVEMMVDKRVEMMVDLMVGKKVPMLVDK